MFYVCWWFMAFLPQVGLNCLKCAMVSASLLRMDGCQHDSVTHSPPCFSLFRMYMLYSFSCRPRPRLAHAKFLCLQLFHYLYSSLLASLSSPLCYFLPFAFFPVICAVDCLPEQHVAGGERKKQPWRKKTSSLTKAPSPELACSCKKIHQLPQWLNDVSTTLRMLPLLRWMAQLGSV